MEDFAEICKRCNHSYGHHSAGKNGPCRHSPRCTCQHFCGEYDVPRSWEWESV